MGFPRAMSPLADAKRGEKHDVTYTESWRSKRSFQYASRLSHGSTESAGCCGNSGQLVLVYCPLLRRNKSQIIQPSFHIFSLSQVLM